MERKVRQFKRSQPRKGNYGEKFKDELNIHNFQYKRYNPFETEIRCEIIRRKDITKVLKILLIGRYQ